MKYEEIDRKPYKRGFLYKHEGLDWKLGDIAKVFGLTESQLNARVQAIRSKKGNISSFDEALKKPILNRKSNLETPINVTKYLWPAGSMAQTIR